MFYTTLAKTNAQDNSSLKTPSTWSFTFVVLPSCCLPTSRAGLLLDPPRLASPWAQWKTSQHRSSSPPHAGDYGAGHPPPELVLPPRPPPATTLPVRNTAAITSILTLDSICLGETADLKMNHDEHKNNITTL